MRLLFSIFLMLLLVSCSTDVEQYSNLEPRQIILKTIDLKQIKPDEIVGTEIDSLFFIKNLSVPKVHYFEENIGQMTNTFAKALPVKTAADTKFPEKNTISPELYQKLLNDNQLDRYLLITFDNDIFAETDYYYTNGFSIGLIHPWFNNRLFYRLMPGLGQVPLNLYGMRIQQQMFTPYNPEAVEVIPDDRPFAGVLLAEFFKLSNRSDKGLFLQTSFRLGVIGPASLAGVLQSSAHELKPTGWDYQIANDLLINVDMNLQKAFKINKYIEMAGGVDVGLGTYKTYMGASAQLRAGNFRSFSNNISSSTIGLIPRFDKSISYWFFLEPAFHFVAYDATLNGGMLNKSSPHRFSYDQIHHLTTQFNAGFSVFYRNTGLSLRWTRISPEFIGGKKHNWGNISLTHNF
ncbi:MAG: lipid A deacylase LpxR family protein [Bacteroidales bacterium]|nr:lipid A deacylase LpxR family protein [Bacteroidales bacterium]